MIDSRIHYVYIYYRLNGVPLYVGKGFGRRWKKHATAKRANKHLQNSIRKAQREGLELPVYKIAENLSDAEACALEIQMITIFGRADLGLGPLCNLTSGGDGPFNPSPERRMKIGASSRGRRHGEEFKEAARQRMLKRWANMTAEERKEKNAKNRGPRGGTQKQKEAGARRRGRKTAESTKKLLSEIAKNRPKRLPRSAESRERSRQSMLGKNTGPQSLETVKKKADANRGKKRSPEHCAKMSELQKGHIKSPAWCAAISRAKKGKPSPFKGIKKTPEQLAKIAATKERNRLAKRESLKKEAT